MDYSNLAGLRDTFRIRTGLVEAGTSGDTRLNAVLNLAVRQLEQDAPDIFKRKELRLLLQPQYTTESLGGITLERNPEDFRCFRLSGTPTSAMPTNEQARGKWLDITDSEGVVRTMRVTSQAFAQTSTDFGGSSAVRFCLYVDRPWASGGSTGLSFRMYTLDYPLPADVRDVEEVIWNPDIDGSTVLQNVQPAELDDIRRGSWTEDGVPAYWAEGDFTQLRAPHDTPLVTKTSGSTASNKWGYTSGGVQDTTYEPAGTFSYCYCLVRGRLRSHDRALVEEDGQGQEYAPFYISAPSPPSAQISTTWGGGCINVGSVDQDWHDQRKVTAGTTMKAAFEPVSGLEKWWFRATHASAGDNPSASGLPTEADGVYRLWRIKDATSISVVDRGDFGPTDYGFPLKEFTGHKSIRFDVFPVDDNQQVLVRALVRPDVLRADSDILPFPPGAATEAVICQAASYICERDSEFDKAKYYKGLYEFHINKLRERDGWVSAKTGGFGDGISVGNGRTWKMTRRITETS